MDAAMREASELSLLTERGRRIAATIDGVTMILWLGIRKHHPKVTTDDICECLFDQDAAAEAMKVFNMANGQNDADDEKKTEAAA